MNILYIGRTVFPDGDAVAQRILSNSRLFNSLGHNVTLLGLNSNCNNRGNVDGIQFDNIIVPTGSFMTSIKTYRTKIDNHGYDILICYNFPAAPLFQIMRLARRDGVKVVADCTEWYMPKGNLLKRIFRKMDIDCRMKYLHKRVDGLIVISSFLRDYYSKHKNIILLPPLVDRSDAQWERQEVSSDELNIVFAGTIGFGNKDRVDWIVESLSDISCANRLKVNIFGVSAGEYTEAYHYSKPIPDYIVFHGKVSHSEVIKALTEADFQIFFREHNISNMAGFPTKFAEAVSAGALVITNSTSDLPAMIEKLKAGFIIDITSKEVIKESLASILEEHISLIREREMNIDTDAFDYKRYTPEAESFFKKLQES